MKDLTLKQLMNHVRSYAEEHTALFLGICTGAVSAMALILRLLYYCYQVGYYSYFGIDLALLGEAGGNALLTAVIYVAVACLIIMFNLVGYLFYRNNRLLVYLGGCYLLFVFMFLLILLFTTGVKIFDDLRVIARFLLFFPAILSLAIHSILLGCIAVPGKEDRKRRIKNQLIRSKLRPQKRKKLQEELEAMENTLSDAEIVSQKVDGLPIWIRLFVPLGILALMVVMTIVLGFLQAKTRVVFYISEDSAVTVTSGNRDFEEYAILYQNSDYQIVSPCKITDDAMIIYTDHQMKTDTDGHFFVKRRFRTVELQ